VPAPKICSAPGCPNLQPCRTHAAEPWQKRPGTPARLTGARAVRRRQRILGRHGRVCHVCGRRGADQVDHVIPLAEGGTDTDENLRPIHDQPCHRNKTREEAKRARHH
jgi:5-methylcytosine-specific restriction protein A